MRIAEAVWGKKEFPKKCSRQGGGRVGAAGSEGDFSGAEGGSSKGDLVKKIRKKQARSRATPSGQVQGDPKKVAIEGGRDQAKDISRKNAALNGNYQEGKKFANERTGRRKDGSTRRRNLREVGKWGGKVAHSRSRKTAFNHGDAKRPGPARKVAAESVAVGGGGGGG